MIARKLNIYVYYRIQKLFEYYYTLGADGLYIEGNNCNIAITTPACTIIGSGAEGVKLS